ncbi:alpha/beta fold hydrolase [Nocardioides aurantiacus]|uniref:Pimeloyl-ACP methyl ester carboxylesterase n=1 Tax=Nocardioides aurantiacus TaxID=86796 RepID=A0A3N2CYD6_9ACTN|nr:alpha/beta hydrolase [Nocardioides aurantiacus]ROR92496.1 pimeloyl-ACP methyl ester carboxylesterase [Nocardioides aurantiacus]
MRTRDSLWLDVTTYGPDDAPVTVFLAHCWTLDQQDWQYQVRDLLAEHGHGIRIVTWDHRGHGGSSDVTRAGARIELLARDWGDLVDHLAPTGPLVLAGHSIGGMAMLELAEQRPDLFERVVGVALVATSSGDLDTVTLGLPDVGPLVRSQIPRMLALRSMTLSRRARRRAPITERLVMRTLLFGTPVRLGDVALAVEGLISCPGATVVGYYEDCLRHDRATALQRFAGIPTHVLVGSRDVLTPPAHARVLAEGIPGATLTVAPGAGHMLPLERDALVSATLVGLLRPYAGRALPDDAAAAAAAPSRGVAS